MAPRLGPRYSVVRRLGQGSQGAVYLVRDLVAARQAAVKILGPDSEQRADLQREFALLARLRHPGLAAVYDLGVTPAGELYLAREYVDGDPLDTFWRRRGQNEGLRAIGQLLGTLDFLHRRGVVHRDIKPENVLVSGSGVKLLDFGLAAPSGAAAVPAGTVGYIAPEVLAGAAASTRSDLYGVGALLHLLVCGRPVFSGSAGEVARAQLEREVELPPDLSPRLAQLLRALLARDPALRPGSAAEALSAVEEELGSPGCAAGFLAGLGLPSPVLVGRASQLAAADEALAAALRGPAVRALLITGNPGEGRTSLGEEIACRAQLLGVRLQRGIPLAGPTVPSAPATAEGPLAVQQVVDRVRALAGEPLLLWIDGVLATDESQALLALSRYDDLRLVICASTLRGSEADRALSSEFQRLSLGPLGQEQTEELVGSMLPAGWATRELARTVSKLSGGNPLLAVEATRHLVAQHLQRGSHPDRAETLPAELERLCALRLAPLSAEARRLLGLAALFEEGVPAALASRVLGCLPRELSEKLVLGGFLREHLPRLKVASGTLAHAVLRELPPEELTELGRQALALLLEEHAPAPARAQVALAAHLDEEQSALLIEGAREARRALELGTSARLYRAAIGASRSAPERRQLLRELAAVELSLGENRSAASALTDALRLAEPGERAAALSELADAQLRAGDLDAALSTLEQARGLPGPSAALATQAKVLLFAGRHTEAGQLARRVGPDDAEAQAEAQHVLGLAHYYRGDLTEAADVLTRALGQARSARSPLTEARVLNSLALVHQRRSEYAQARDRYQQCLQLARELRHLPFETTFLMNLGSAAQQQGELAQALEEYQRSLEVAQRFGGARETAQVLHNLGRVRALLGQEAQALGLLGRSLALAERLGWRSLMAQNLLAQGEIHSEAGRSDEARAAIGSAEEMLRGLGEATAVAEAALARCRLLIRCGDAASACQQAAEVLERSADQGEIRLQAQLVLGWAELERAGGSPELAARHLRAAVRQAEDCGQRGCLVEAHYRLALALAAMGDPAEAGLQRQSARLQLQRELDALPALFRRVYAASPLRQSVLEHASDEDDRRASRSPAARLEADLLAALLEINKELNAEPDLQRLLERIIDHAVELAGAERGFLLLRRAGELEIQVGRNIDQETIRRKEFKISRSVAEEVLRSGRPVLTVDALEDTRFREFLSVHHLRLRSVLCVPMSIRRQLRGAIYLDNRFQTQAFTSQHARLLSALVEQAGLALGNWELLEENRARQRELEQSREELRRVNSRLELAIAEQSLKLEELTRLAESQRGELQSRYQFETLVGQSAAMREVFRLMDRVTSSEAPVLIQGESGTGKELVAKALHYAGPRREGPFVPINCGALPATLLESELFGYERGAFTGAERQHRGLFERADGGSLFLDEVGDMPPELQVKLLRVLQEKVFSRVGGEHELSSDFRLIAASNKDLQQLAREGRFRQDLYFRINVITLRLPPLRARREDIPLLIQHLLQRHAPPERQVAISPAAMRRLLDHDWPGNVRELENQILRALALAESIVTPDDLSLSAPSSSRLSEPSEDGLPLREALRRLEKRILAGALRAAGGNVTEAARQLGLTRVGLHKAMRRHGLARSTSTA